MTGHILVADDDITLTEALQIILEGEGYAVEIVREGQLVSERIIKGKPGLLILDYKLPGENGIAVAKKLMDSPETRKLPIVMISASVDVQQKALEVGITNFLAKPFDIDELLKVVKKLTL